MISAFCPAKAQSTGRTAQMEQDGENISKLFQPHVKSALVKAGPD